MVGFGLEEEATHVRVPRGKTDERVAHPGVLRRDVVEGRLGHRAGPEVDPPLVHHRQADTRAVGAHSVRRDPRAGQHNPVAHVERVRRVREVTRLDVEPPDMARRVGAVEHADPRDPSVVPSPWRPGLARRGEVEHEARVDEQSLRGRDGEVVHQRADGQLDLDRPQGTTITRRAVIGEEGAPHRVAEEEQVPRRRTPLGVRGHRAAETAVEGEGSDGVELGGQSRKESRPPPARADDPRAAPHGCWRS